MLDCISMWKSYYSKVKCDHYQSNVFVCLCVIEGVVRGQAQCNSQSFFMLKRAWTITISPVKLPVRRLSLTSRRGVFSLWERMDILFYTNQLRTKHDKARYTNHYWSRSHPTRPHTGKRLHILLSACYGHVKQYPVHPFRACRHSNITIYSFNEDEVCHSVLIKPLL